MQAHACAQRKVVLALKRFMGLGDASCPGGGVAGGLGRKGGAWAGGLGFAYLGVSFMKGILGGGIIAGIPGGLL